MLALREEGTTIRLPQGFSELKIHCSGTRPLLATLKQLTPFCTASTLMGTWVENDAIDLRQLVTIHVTVNAVANKSRKQKYECTSLSRHTSTRSHYNMVMWCSMDCPFMLSERHSIHTGKHPSNMYDDFTGNVRRI